VVVAPALTVHRVVPILLQLLLLGLITIACSNDEQATRAEPTDANRATEITDDIAVALSSVHGPSAPVGEAFVVEVALRNRGPRSVSVPYELRLSAPDGGAVPFHETSLFVPAGDVATEQVGVTPAQWFADRGSFDVALLVDGRAIGDALELHVSEPRVTVPLFEDVTDAAGLATTVPAASCGQFSNGAAWGDVDGDGSVDLLVTRLGDPAELFVNDGAGQFTAEGEARGLAVRDANGAAFADYDNDGDADVVLVRDASDLLFRNDGSGRFTDVSAAAGIGDDDYRGMSAAWGDFDADGHLDLYVTNYMQCLGEWSTEADIITEVSYYPDTLYRNNGDGTFDDVTGYLENDPDEYDDGTTIGAGFGAAWLDHDGDGRLDLYLANDFVGPTPDHNRLWRNDGPGAGGWTFSDVSVETGTALFMNTMGIAVGDVDRDLDADLALTNIGANKLLRNDGSGSFVEDLDGGAARPTQESWYPSITWGAGLHDLNLDGWDDLYLAAGNFLEGVSEVVGVQPNELYVNDGAGTFLDVSAATGADDPGDSKGVAFADYDADGDVDLFVVNQGGEPRLYRNVTPTDGRHWLEIDTIGTISNRDGCGARLIVTTAEGQVTRAVSCGSGGAGSASQRTVHMGLGSADAVSQLEVLWPSGVRQHVDDVEVDRVITIEEEAP
jgi:enediyne biosynthesis protein E4